MAKLVLLLCLLWVVAAQYNQIMPATQSYTIDGVLLRPTSNEDIRIALTNSTDFVADTFSSVSLQLRGNSGTFGIGFRTNQDKQAMWRLSGMPANPVVDICYIGLDDIICGTPIAEFNPQQVRDVVMRVRVEDGLLMSELFLGPQRFTSNIPESFFPDNGEFTLYFEDASAMSVSNVVLADSDDVALLLYPTCVSEADYEAIYRRATGATGDVPARDQGENGQCCDGVILRTTTGTTCASLPVTQSFEAEATGGAYQDNAAFCGGSGLDSGDVRDLVNVPGKATVDSTAASDGSIGFDVTFTCDDTSNWNQQPPLGVVTGNATDGSKSYAISGGSIIKLTFDPIGVSSVDVPLYVTLDASIPVVPYDDIPWEQGDYISIYLYVDGQAQSLFYREFEDEDNQSSPGFLQTTVAATADTIQLEVVARANDVGGAATAKQLYIDNIVLSKDAPAAE